MTSQRDIVLKALLNGDLVNVDTMKVLGVTRLNQALDELTSRGYVIDSTDTVVTHNGKKKHISNHTLVYKPDDWERLELETKFCNQKDGSRYVYNLTVYRVYADGRRVMAAGFNYPHADALVNCLTGQLPMAVQTQKGVKNFREGSDHEQ